MKRIKIFIASSITELTNERAELAKFITGINNIAINHDIYCELILCENADKSMPSYGRKQDEYNQMIKDSDAVFVLFFNKAGEYTLEELDFAHQCFRSCGKPKVYTYFKSFDIGNMTSEVKLAYDRIVDNYKHYFGTFDDISTVEIDMLRIIYDLTLNDSFRVSEKNGTIFFGSEPLMSIEELDYIKNNKRIAELKEKRTQLQARQLSCPSGQDDTLNEELKKNEEELDECYKMCYQVNEARYEHMKSSAEFDLELQMAYNASSAGDYGKVLEILNPSLIEAEAMKLIKEKNISAEYCLDVVFRKQVLYINALTQEQKIDKLDEAYKLAISLICEFSLYKLDPDCLSTWMGYIDYLVLAQRTQDAIESAEALDEIYYHKEFRESAERGRLLGVLGTLYSTVSQIEKAEDYLLDSVDIFKRRRRQLTVNQVDTLIDNYIRLSTFYDMQNRPEAEEYLLDAIDVYDNNNKSLVTTDDKIRFSSLHSTLGQFYTKNERPDKAELYYRSSLSIQEGILEACTDPQQKLLYTYTYTVAKMNLCNFLTLQKNLIHAKELFDELIIALEEYKKTEFPLYQFSLAQLHSIGGLLHHYLTDLESAEKYYLSSISLFTELGGGDVYAMAAPLSLAYSNLSLMYQQCGDENRLMDALVYCKKAMEFSDYLMSQNQEAYVNNHISIASNLAMIYLTLENTEKAKAIYDKNLALCRDLAEKYPERYTMILAINCENIGVTYLQTSFEDENKELLEEALCYLEEAGRLYEDLLQDNFKKIFTQFGNIQCAMISVYNDLEYSDKCIYHCEKLINYAEKAYELFSSEEENQHNLPATAFYLAYSYAAYSQVTDNTSYLEKSFTIILEYCENQIFMSLAYHFEFTEALAAYESATEDSDLDDIDFDDLDLDDIDFDDLDLDDLDNDSDDDSDDD